MDSPNKSNILNLAGKNATEGEGKAMHNVADRVRPVLRADPYVRYASYALGGALLLVAIVALPLLSFWRHGDAPRQVIKPLEITTAKLATVTLTVDAPGKLALYKYMDVGSQLAGQVHDVLVPVGENVKTGRLLVEITPPPDTAHIESNRAQLARLQADLTDQSAQHDFAQLQFQRQTRLMADHATREESLESSRTAMLSSAAKLDAIHAQIQQVEANMKNDEEVRKQSKIAAPMSGTVVSLAVHQGQMLPPGQTGLLRIADLSKMTVQARVAESDVTKLRKGMSATFTTPGLPGKHWSGKLSQIMPLPIDDSAQQGKPSFYTVLFDVANPDHELMSGMNANVGFILSQAENVVTVPSCVLREDGVPNQHVVTVVDGTGKSSERKVVTGLNNGHAAQIVSGLQAGERVSTAACQRIAMITTAQ